MSSERANSGGKKGVHGHRKRSRTPSSSGSESRIAPRNPFGRTSRPAERKGNNINKSKQSSSGGGGNTAINSTSSTSSDKRKITGVAARRFLLGTRDEFLDDVRFDVVPKDMCIAAGSQGSACGEDGSVVLQQLYSLGSVLAGGRCEPGAPAGEEGTGSGTGGGNGGSSIGSGSGNGLPHPVDGGNRSNGAPSRKDPVGGGSLLTRWLQPTGIALHGQEQTCSSNTGETVAKGESEISEAGANSATTSGSGGGGGGARNVSDWAKKALLRKKLADAERGRRLRLQLEEGVSSLAPPAAAAASATPSAAAIAADEAAVEAAASFSATPDAKEFPSAPPAVAVAPSRATSASTSHEERPPQSDGNSPDEREALSMTTCATPPDLFPTAQASSARTSAGRPGTSVAVTGTARDSSGAGDGRAGAGDGGGGAAVEDVDEYGDDFDFLTDADLQALEEQATRSAAAACSQQAASQQVAHLRGNDDAAGRAPASSSGKWASAGVSSQAGSTSLREIVGGGAGASTMAHHKVFNTVDTGVVQPRVAGSKRAFNASAGRPPLSAIGPNPKRCDDHRRQQQDRAASMTGQRCLVGNSQSGSRTLQQHPQHSRSRGKAAPGRGEGAARVSASRSKTSSKNATQRAGVVELSRRKGDGPQECGAPAASDANLFTTYGSMDAFTASLKPGRTANATAGAAPVKGQAHLTDWAQQQQLPTGTRPAASPPAAAVATRVGKEAIPSSYSDSSAGHRLFNPSLVHRRFLVLEVTYVAARAGNGSREKVLLAFEQGLTRAAAGTAVDDDGPDPALAHPANDGGKGDGNAKMALQRTIALREDWYDCDVGPGDVVHVLYPVSSDEGRTGKSGDVSSLAGARTSALDDVQEEEERAFTSQHVVVDNASGRLLVVQPDILVSPTKVADTVLCTRKAVLQSRLASDASKSKAAVMGNLKHELFEKSLLAAAAAAAVPAVAAPAPRAEQQSPAAMAAQAWQEQAQHGRGGGGLLTSQYMAKLAGGIIVSQLEALYGAGVDDATARSELRSVCEPILRWHRSFLAKSGEPGGGRGARIAGRGSFVASGGSGGGSGGGESAGGLVSASSSGDPVARVTVSRVLATEDDVWSPVLGMKGIIDATVEAVVLLLGRTATAAAGGFGGGEGRRASPLVMPVEVKTGKKIGEANTSHRAQVMLYTLLLRLRYGHDASASGLLVYTSAEDLHTELVTPVPAEIRALVLARNRLAVGMSEISRVGLIGRGAEVVQGGAALPPVIQRARECGRCFQNSECMLYHRATEGGDEATSGLEPGVFDGKVGHLSEAHLAYFAHWDRTIDLEAKIGEQVRRTMWQESGPERESRTCKCMSNMVWLGETEQSSVASSDTGSTSSAASAAAVAAARATAAATPAVGDASKTGSKRFKHVFSREWAVSELLPLPGATDASAAAVAAAGNGADGGSGSGNGSGSGSGSPGATARPKGVKSLSDLSLSVGDMVCVSAQGGEPGYHRRRRKGGRGSGLEHVRLLTGNIVAVFEDHVEVSSDKRMRVPRRGRRRGCGGGGGSSREGAEGTLDIEDLLGGGGERPLAEERVLFRIDKDEWAAGISMMRSNVAKLMAGPSPESGTNDGGDNAGDEKRRRLIVDLEAPRFGRFTGLLDVPGNLLGWAGRGGGKNQDEEEGTSSPDGARELEALYRTALNEDQRAAVRKLVTARDYALLLGMPGTGKTWTIAFAVRVLLARGASVLITSYTHSAVDNLLLKLIEEGVPCLRVGKPSSVHPGVRAHCVNFDGAVRTTAAYSELVTSARVVGCTCLGVKHPLFSHRRFDYCVVDEAGQISQPVVLAPLRCADVFVLVGDHYQLPPLVTSSEALEAGMSESLFRRLCEAHPSSLQRLSYQYRMNGDVMALCNDLIYSGRLRCGNAQVEGQRIVLPNPGAIPLPRRSRTTAAAAAASGPAWQRTTPPSRLEPTTAGSKPVPWLTEVLDPDRRVAFLDTDALTPDGRGDVDAGVWGAGGGIGVRGVLSAREQEAGRPPPFSGLEVRSVALLPGNEDHQGRGTLVNMVECDVVRLLAWGLHVGGFDLGRVGVISPYRSQVQLLQAELRPSYPLLEINTIDKYQGRDKEVIVVSFVRSNAEGTVGHLLRDWRRLNVALSRAKCKLLLVGSLCTLRSCAVLSCLAGILKTRGWVYPLPPGAHQTYPRGLGSPINGDNERGLAFAGAGAASTAASAKGGDYTSERPGTKGLQQCEGEDDGGVVESDSPRTVAVARPAPLESEKGPVTELLERCENGGREGGAAGGAEGAGQRCAD